MSIAPSSGHGPSNARSRVPGFHLRALLLGMLVVAVTNQAVFAQVAEFRFRQWHSSSSSSSSSSAAVVPNPNCSIVIPPNPLTAQGLATPYQLKATVESAGACSETNGAQSAYVQAVIFDPATSQISVYNPLVITAGTQPAAAPVVPTLPRDAIVALYFGYNGGTLLQTAENPDTLTASDCVNGTPGSPFTQVSWCNAPAFLDAVNAAIEDGKLTVPPLGTAKDGQTCPTTRDFSVVDQDQSDNVPVSFLLTSSGQVAQNTTANVKRFPTATPEVNPGDNALLDNFILPAIGCTPWTVPDLADPGTSKPAQILNELSARTNQATPVAVMPDLDPMTEVDAAANLTKDNAYRTGVDQPLASSVLWADTARYCRQMLRIGPSRIALDEPFTQEFPSLAPAAANNTFTFLVQRFVASYQILTCQSLIGIADPVSFTTNTAGVAVTGVINTAAVQAAIKQLSGSAQSDNADDAAEFSLLATEP